MSTQKNPLNFPSHLTESPRSHYSTSFEFYPGQFSKVDKKGKKVYKPIKNAPMETIAVNLVESEKVQQLTFTYTAPITENSPKTIASFNLHSNMSVEWITDPMFGGINKRVAISAYSALTVEVTSLGELFTFWLTDDDFTANAKVLASRLVYPPKLMKMIYLWIAYHDERSAKGWEEQELSENTAVNLDRVSQKFKGYIGLFAGDVPYMKPHYSVPDSFKLFAPNQGQVIPQLESTNLVDNKPDAETGGDSTAKNTESPTIEIANVEVTEKVVETKPSTTDTNTAMLDRINNRSKAKNK